MGRKIKPPKHNLNASGPVSGYQEAVDSLLIRHSAQIIATAEKSSDRQVEISIKGLIDISQPEPKIEVKIDVRHVESFKDSITGVVDVGQGRFTEVLNEASESKRKKGESEEPKDGEDDLVED